MSIRICSYNEGVTGSCIKNIVYFKSGKSFRFLVDYGLYQGEGHTGIIDYNKNISPKDIETILLTHPHLDHDGGLPILVKKGYNKPIYMSDAAACTIDIGYYDNCNIIKRKCKAEKTKPIFTEKEIEKTLKLIRPVKFVKPFKIHDWITVTFLGNAHLIGAAMILVQINEPGEDQVNILYMGDYRKFSPILAVDPIPSWVYALPNLTIVCESTYGTTNSWDIKHNWENDIIEACSQQKSIVNLAFAKGRFQELAYYIRQLQDKKEIPKNYLVRMAGKTAIDYTFRCMSNSNIIKFKHNMDSLLPYNIQFIDKNNSKCVFDNKPQILLMTSGMGDNGSAIKYLPYFLEKSNSLIYVPGYAAEKTTARKIIDASHGEKLRIYGTNVTKYAEVAQTLQFSLHAPADVLTEFLSRFNPVSVLITHGAPDVKKEFEIRVKKELFIKKTGILGMGYDYQINSYGIDKIIKQN